MQACRVAAQQHDLGDDASDSLIAYLYIHRYLLDALDVPDREVRQYPGQSAEGKGRCPERYDPTAAASSIEEMDAVVCEARSRWRLNEYDIREAIEFDSQNWKGQRSSSWYPCGSISSRRHLCMQLARALERGVDEVPSLRLQQNLRQGIQSTLVSYTAISSSNSA